jgi:hypothetical protein
LITVPVYVLAAIACVVLALIADKYQTRSPILIFGLTVSLIGYILMYTVAAPGVRYFGAFLAAAGSCQSRTFWPAAKLTALIADGGFPSIVCLLTNNCGGQTKRSVEIVRVLGPVFART